MRVSFNDFTTPVFAAQVLPSLKNGGECRSFRFHSLPMTPAPDPRLLDSAGPPRPGEELDAARAA